MVKQKLIETFKQRGLMADGASKFIIKTDDGSETDIIELVETFMKENALLQVISDVKDFCITGGQVVETSEANWDKESKDFRIKLIRDELEELEEAAENRDAIEERDAITDLIYVIAGYSLRRGIAGSISVDWKAIHDNNMSKFCSSEEEARDTVAKYKRQNHDCYREHVNGKWVIKSSETAILGKVLKSHLYKPVILKPTIPLD